MNPAIPVLCGGLLAVLSQSVVAEAAPRRAVLFIIDGLHWQAPERLGMKTFLELAGTGARVDRVEGILPAHPKTRDYAAIHSGSIPNPVMLAGSSFIRPRQPLIQDVFAADEWTAHVTNSRAYESLDPGFEFSMVADTTDDAAITEALSLFKHHDIRFMRIHLQDTGSGGWKCHNEKSAVPWRRDIWAEGSPYVAAARHADELLGEFIAGMKAMGKWDGTLLVVTSDHGNARTGAHPITEEDSRMSPLVITGPGIRRGARIGTAESIDIVPTICHLMQKPPPNADGGSGRVIAGVLAGEAGTLDPPAPKLGPLNRQILEFHALVARLHLAGRTDPAIQTELEKASDQFLGLERITDWPQHGDIAAILARNESVLARLRALDPTQNPK